MSLSLQPNVRSSALFDAPQPKEPNANVNLISTVDSRVRTVARPAIPSFDTVTQYARWLLEVVHEESNAPVHEEEGINDPNPSNHDSNPLGPFQKKRCRFSEEEQNHIYGVLAEQVMKLEKEGKWLFEWNQIYPEPLKCNCKDPNNWCKSTKPCASYGLVNRAWMDHAKKNPWLQRGRGKGIPVKKLRVFLTEEKKQSSLKFYLADPIPATPRPYNLGPPVTDIKNS